MNYLAVKTCKGKAKKKATVSINLPNSKGTVGIDAIISGEIGMSYSCWDRRRYPKMAMHK